MVVAPEREPARQARSGALSAVQAEPAGVVEVGVLFRSLAEAGNSLPAASRSPGQGRRPTHRAVLRAQAIMRQRLAEKITLSGVADEVGLTATYLSHLFHAEAGHSFQSHLINLRLGHALFLLEKGDQTVAAVRQACGYEDAGYFARLVRGRTGLTPGEIRRRGSAASATAT
jgi:transcriptional regulator GlxA family with amidase domain